MYKQDIKLHVTADPSRVQEVAMETVLEVADTISFVTDRRIEVSLNLLNKSSSQSGQPETPSMLFVRRFKGPQDLAPMGANFLVHITEQIGDVESDRGRRIVRALRWLRRGYLANDEVEEFATLAMGFEALSSLLPRPPAKGSSTKKGKGKKPPSKPGTSEVLRHWAVKKCSLTQQDWKQVGSLRHELFHGGITENAAARSRLAVAVPNLKLALGLAIKHVLNLPEAGPPHLGSQPFVITGLQITAPPFIPASDSSPNTPPDDDSDPD
jgi:hypothetical protein